MKITEYLAPLLGAWQGTNGMRLMPTDDYEQSPAGAEIAVTAKSFVTINYTWATEGQTRDGLLLLSDSPEPDSVHLGVKAIWADSWHSSPAWMSFTGTRNGNGLLCLEESYPAPAGPDCGWQIQIDPGAGVNSRITMHNLVPGHPAYQVVELTLQR